MTGYCTVCGTRYKTLGAYIWHTQNCAGPVICRRHQASHCACPPYEPRRTGSGSTTPTRERSGP